MNDIFEINCTKIKNKYLIPEVVQQKMSIIINCVFDMNK
jgi:hypothetical protein